MKKSIKDKVEYLDGYLNALSNLCSRSNFVPHYGAEVVPNIKNNIKESLAAHLSPDELTSFENLNEWQNTIKKHIKTIVTERLKTADWAHYFDLLEDEILSNNSGEITVYYFKSSGKKYEYTNEGYIFSYGDSIFMLYFWWSD